MLATMMLSPGNKHHDLLWIRQRIEASEFAWDELREWIETERAIELERSLRSALRVDKIHPDDVGDASVRRVASSAKLQTLAADDPFLSLVGRLNLG